MTKSIQFTQSIRSWMDVFMHRSMRGWGLFARSTGLSMPQFSVLMQLHHKGACGMSEINERFAIFIELEGQKKFHARNRA